MGEIFTVFWQGWLMVTFSLILLKIAGRKSWSEMTIFHFAVMVGIGDLIIEPITRESIVGAMAGVVTFVLFMLVNDHLELKFSWFEKYVVGYAKLLVKDGKIIEKNLKKQRMTVDLLEMKLRQLGVKSFKHCETVTLEANGQLGFDLYEKDEPLKYEDFEALLDQRLEEYFGKPKNPPITPLPKNTELFDEVRKEHNEHGKFSEQLE